MWQAFPGWHPTELFHHHAMICGDRKKILDFIACLEDGRHLNQIRSAHEAGYVHQFLILEGTLREGLDDSIKLRKRDRPTEITYSHVKAYLNQISRLMNVQVIRTRNLKETVREIHDLYLMYQSSPEDHDTLKKFYSAPLPSVTMKPSLIRRMIKEAAYIGWERSLDVEKRFPTIQEMVNATEEDWQSIDGFGTVIAHSAVQELQT
jgi:ERCC4-type nuclease